MMEVLPRLDRYSWHFMDNIMSPLEVHFPLSFIPLRQDYLMTGAEPAEIQPMISIYYISFLHYLEK
jgi:hypothetical protein